MKKTSTVLLVLAGLIASTQATVIQITNITEYNGKWSTPSGDVVISGDSDVSIDGTLIQALNFGSVGTGSVTINGVTFQNIASPGTGSIDTDYIDVAGNNQIAKTGLGSATGAFTGLSANYQSLLSESTDRDSTIGNYLNFGGLTVGQEYQIQFWINDSSVNTGTYNDTRLFFGGNVDEISYIDEGVTVTGGTIQVSVNNTATTGGLGSYVIGTFTADDAQISIKLNSGTYGINAAQLRAIPEPATLGLVTASATALLAIRRFFRM